MKNMFVERYGVSLSQFYNSETLNIFCDASIYERKGKFCHGCYGVVAVVNDEIIDTEYRIVSNTTNNNSEIKAIRAALSMANKYKSIFRFINIFSDSQVSVFGLRDYIYKWRFNKNDCKLYGTAGTPIANQSIFVECHQLLADLGVYTNCTIRFYHQAGHVNNGYNSLREAAMIFAKSNNIAGSIDLNFIRYISTYNNFVDSNSRSLLKRSNLNLTYCDPISFEAKGRINRY